MPATMLKLQPDSSEEDSNEKVIQSAIARMQQCFEKHFKVSELARELDVSYHSFRKMFTERTGRSPYNYLLEIRLAHARSLLAQSSLSVKEIAVLSGFKDAQYFCRFFHKKAGTSPGLWRVRAENSVPAGARNIP
jgi:transcriptional regulator GlxA family with amidase domain